MKFSQNAVRKIVVDNQEFKWKAGWEWVALPGAPGVTRLLRFRSWRGIGRGSTLRVKLVAEPASNAYIEPRIAAELIRAALAAGWQPDATTKDYSLPSSAILELTGFNIIEKL